MKTSALGSVVVSLVVLTACSQPVAQPSTLTIDPNTPTDVLPVDHPPITGSGGGSGAGGGSGGGTLSDGGTVPALQMGTRRLSVAQLQASLPIVLGGNTWMVNSTEGFTARAGTLGVANYVSVVQDSLEPSPLYLKFMGDAARDACNRTLNDDLSPDAGPPPGSETLFRFANATDTIATAPAKIDANLRYLRLRFHGVKVAATDTVPIEQYRTLFKDAFDASKATSATDKVAIKEGWRAVCVGLLTAPEYHLY